MVRKTAKHVARKRKNVGEEFQQNILKISWKMFKYKKCQMSSSTQNANQMVNKRFSHEIKIY